MTFILNKPYERCQRAVSDVGSRSRNGPGCSGRGDDDGRGTGLREAGARHRSRGGPSPTHARRRRGGRFRANPFPERVASSFWCERNSTRTIRPAKVPVISRARCRPRRMSATELTAATRISRAGIEPLPRSVAAPPPGRAAIGAKHPAASRTAPKRPHRVARRDPPSPAPSQCDRSRSGSGSGGSSPALQAGCRPRPPRCRMWVAAPRSPFHRAALGHRGSRCRA